MILNRLFPISLTVVEYDQAENALFSMVRIAYMAGWLAAGGEPPQAHKVIELQRIHKDVIVLAGMNTDIEV